MNNKENNFKEKFKQALISTSKVISNDYKIDLNKNNKNLSSKNLDFFEIDNLNNKHDFLKLRAEADSEALKKKFSNQKIYNKNLPNNASCKTLYNLSEKIRYEILGSKMLKGISKNLNENYNQKLNLKRKDKLSTKKDVDINEAFEIYMLKKFFNIKLNPLSNKILSFWENEFNSSFDKHINFLNQNLENQENYNSKFSEILEKMNIFNSEKDKEQNNQENEQNKDSENSEDNQSKQEQNKQDESKVSADSDNNTDEFKIDEQLVDTDSIKQSSEQVEQKVNSNISDIKYKIFSTQFDEIAKAETLESVEEISKLRKNLDQQLLTFQNLITKLANKLQRQLLAKQNRAWDFDLEEGLLDSSKLTRIIMDPYNSLSFKKKKT